MKSEKVCINKMMVSAQRACVSVFDRGLNYGDGLFETMKAYAGRPFLLEEHLRRLNDGAGRLGIPAPDPEEMEERIKKLLKINNLTRGEAYIKVILTRGKDNGGHLPKKNLRPTVIIIANALDGARLQHLKKKGVNAILLGIPHGLSFGVKGGIKSLNYLPNVLGKLEASRKGAYEGIFTWDGEILEGTSTNVFVVKGGILRTPPCGKSGILPGIMRKAIIGIAMGNRIPFEEAQVKAGEIKRCDEAFLTNSIVEVLPVTKIDSSKIGDGRPGKMTRLLQESLREKIPPEGNFL